VTRSIRKVVLVSVVVSLVLLAFLKFTQLGPFKVTKELTTVKTDKLDAIEVVADLGEVITEIEKNKVIDKQIKEQLVEQGYPEAVVDELLFKGAQRAVPLPNIAAVKETYGTPWNLKLYVGEYELVGLYVVGNDEDSKFVLGQYESGDTVIFVHMSKTVPTSVLQAGLVYSSEQQLDHYITYLNESGAIVGFKFDVELDDGIATYVATGSNKFTQEDVNSFISSIVDGVLR